MSAALHPVYITAFEKMSRTGYTALAVFVVVIAAGVYVYQERRSKPASLNGVKVAYASVNEASLDEAAKPEDHSTATENKAGEITPKASEENDKNADSQSRQEPEHLNGNSRPPAGHLEKLGAHGSPIMTTVVEELDYVPNGKDFYAHFVRKMRPLVIRGAAKDWPAVQFWGSESQMSEKYGDVVFDVEFTKRYENRPPIKKTMSLKEFLKIYKSQPVYLDCPFPQTKMTQDVQVPYCLQCEEIMSRISSTHLLYSSGNTSSSCHQDGYENLLTIISGKKEVLVANSSFTEYFYPNNYTTVPGLSPIDPEAVDLLKFPDIAKVPFHKVRCGYIMYASIQTCPPPPSWQPQGHLIYFLCALWVFNTRIFNTRVFNTRVFNTRVFNTRAFNMKMISTRAFNTRAFNMKIISTRVFNTRAFNMRVIDTRIFNTRAFKTRMRVFDPRVFNTRAFNIRVIDTRVFNTRAFNMKMISTRVFNTRAFKTRMWVFDPRVINTRTFDMRVFDTRYLTPEHLT